MDIIVQGVGTKSFKPDLIIVSFSFKTIQKDYESALAEGVKNVESYLKLLESMDFDKKDVKTLSFRVSENRVYNESTRKYDFDGFMFTQNAELKFDYDMKRMSKLMEQTSKLKNAPVCKLDFSIKDSKQAEEELIALAYQEAEFQAKAIAKASGKEVKECVKVSFEPFNAETTSRSRYDAEYACMSKCSSGVADSIQNIFVPEDVEVSHSLYCQFFAN